VAESPADGYFFPFSSCGFENPQAQKNIVAGLRTFCFFSLCLINIHTKSSYFINTLQVIYSKADRERIASRKEKTKECKQRTKEGANLTLTVITSLRFHHHGLQDHKNFFRSRNYYVNIGSRCGSFISTKLLKTLQVSQ
jgi:hypothetical protein